ncbi:exoribonuclease II [Candidatus Palibaumannia cicadellinicola]|uniref:Exoribonuclease 2 n=1 Tax=Candidatus Palibaumannia cicadellinicola TaxID=186490 RepID=A0A2N4XW48_9GAMM|nr:exoribonuclease II [Candidatus Baumannia cicadellinicola]PLK58135.1 exoribonuclease II [Candidatus Baumannia cicadellinicola]
MFHNNPLLIQLKQQLHSKTPRTEGVVKGTDKGFGFLEVDSQNSYFIPPYFMKRVMHGDKIRAVLHTEKDRQIAEPEALIEPFLSRFVGKIQIKDDRVAILPDHRLIKEVIPARPQRGVSDTLCTGDWVVAEMCRHPLEGHRYFYAQITEIVTTSSDNFAPWWVTLAKHNLEREAPAMPKDLTPQDDGLIREDLTALNFITIDNPSTEDMDDALHVDYGPNEALVITIAIADPTAWIIAGSQLDTIASNRAFTNYLPGFNIPMLPRMLSDNLCSLRAYEKRPALVCQVTMQHDGTLEEDIRFFTAWIESKAKLTYDQVSNWLENGGGWQPKNNALAEQIRLLHKVYKARSSWRAQHALVFKDKPDYRFILDEKGEVNNIIAEPRCIAKRMIEEAMIAANVCAARVLRDGLGFGLYNTHNGFDAALVNQAVAILRNHHIPADANQLLTLKGFCALRRQLNEMPTSYLDSRIRRFQTFAELKTEPGPHFGLGLDVYATWTSPIRKYSDMMNHRLLKALIGARKAERPKKEITLRMSERRRQNRIAERDVEDWLYARFLQQKAGSDIRYRAEIIDICRSGMRVRLVDNGAIAFIPAIFIHSIRDELVCNQDLGTVQVKGVERYRQGDTIEVTIAEVRMDNHSIIANIVSVK